jgi:hypothetical protein
MRYTPRSVAALDQLDAGVRDLFDRYDIDLTDDEVRKAVLVCVIACCQTLKDNKASAQQSAVAISFMLDALLRQVESRP